MKVVLQDGIKDCGICCLLSIIRYYKGEVSKEYLREITNTTKDGVYLYNLIEGAKEIGFEAIGVSGKLEDIKVNNLPCIAHIIVNKNYKHFIVIYQIKEDKKQLIIMDPAKGKKNISFSEYNLLSSSNYIFLKPIKKLPIFKKKNIIYKSIKKLHSKNKPKFILIFILTLSYFIISIITSFHFKYLLEYSIKYNLIQNIGWFSSTLIILYLLKNINLTFRNILLNKWNAIFDLETTTLTYQQILLLPYLYYKNRTTGEIISRLKDLTTVRSFLSNFFCTITTDLISIFIFICIMYQYNSKLTILILIPLFIMVIYNVLSQKYKKRNITLLCKYQDKINSDFIQGISNVDTIKGSHLEKRLFDKFTIHYKLFLEKLYRYNLWLEVSLFLKNNIKDYIYIILYGFGSYYVITEKLTLSNLIIYQAFFSYFLTSFYNILSLLEEYHSYKVSLERIEEIFMISPDSFKNNYYYLPFTLNGDIIINDLKYKIGNKYLFNNLNLTIKQGEKVLLSGQSGSGKSTLVKMLLRYVDVPYSKISIAGIDINHYHLENIRSNITYVTSNEYLFTDSIRNNISLYKDKKEEDLKKVCDLCLVNDLIKNNVLGYDSLIEENGFNFSNGERQRIILARSILRKSNIYILDEALGQIDINREKKILQNIFAYLNDKTIIVISHRFNNKKLFDRILKLEKGRINES